MLWKTKDQKACSYAPLVRTRGPAFSPLHHAVSYCSLSILDTLDSSIGVSVVFEEDDSDDEDNDLITREVKTKEEEAADEDDEEGQDTAVKATLATVNIPLLSANTEKKAIIGSSHTHEKLCHFLLCFAEIRMLMLCSVYRNVFFSCLKGTSTFVAFLSGG